MALFENGSSSIYYEETGAGDPVVVLPGFSGSIADHAPLRTLLSRDYRVIAVDLPGSGKSGPQPRRYTRSYFEDDAQAISALIGSRTKTSAHFVGHSSGGEVALLVAALRSDLVRSVVVWGAAGVVPNSHRDVITGFERVIDDAPPELADYRAYLVEAYGEDNARAMTRSFASVMLSILEDGGDISLGKASQIASPVLLIAGEHDVIAPKSLIDEYATRVPLAKTVEIEGAGHDPHRSHADRFAQLVLKWLVAH